MASRAELEAALVEAGRAAWAAQLIQEALTALEGQAGAAQQVLALATALEIQERLPVLQEAFAEVARCLQFELAICQEPVGPHPFPTQERPSRADAADPSKTRRDPEGTSQA